jgi:hypothetical protein
VKTGDSEAPFRNRSSIIPDKKRITLFDAFQGKYLSVSVGKGLITRGKNTGASESGTAGSFSKLSGRIKPTTARSAEFFSFFGTFVYQRNKYFKRRKNKKIESPVK